MRELAVEVAVVGGGPAGLTAAVALASAGVETALIAPEAKKPDNRTTALLTGSVAALRELGAWDRCAGEAAPLRAIRIVDDTKRLFRAPEVTFDASEIGLEAFGYNIENRHLVAALEACAAEFPDLKRFSETAAGIAVEDDGVEITLASERRISARLVVGADGRRSLARQAAGIATTASEYPQSALTLNLAHTRPHDGVSTEFHTESGPFTLVPLPGLRSSLVCVVTRREAKRLSALSDDLISAEIERRSHSILGKVTVDPRRGVFPLGVEWARSVATNRTALIGEAAHVFPPIGAQGLNLGLRDAATIAELVIDAWRKGEDVGAEDVLARYRRLRRADVITRTAAVDLLNRTLLSDFLPVQGLRGFGLYLLDRISPLRRAVMREGVSPSLAEPRLMRGEAL